MSNSESLVTSDGPGGELSAKIAAQGDLVRQLKTDKKSKEEIDTAVKGLLALKVNCHTPAKSLVTEEFRLVFHLNSSINYLLG